VSDLNKRRIDIYATIAAKCVIDRLPAPSAINAYDNGILALGFDSAWEADEWTLYLELTPAEQTYAPDWHDKPVRSVRAHGEWEGWRLQLAGWTEVVSSAIQQEEQR
jgi:hypothetical protein